MQIVKSLLPVGAIAVFAVVAYLVITGSEKPSHTVYVTVPEATGAIAGQPVRSAGAELGNISSATVVNGGHDARLKLSIDDQAWPLPPGTTMTLRWGGTISASDRYIQLDRGPGNGSMVSDGGNFPAKDFHVPVEYDQTLGIFTPKVRSSVKTLVKSSGSELSNAKGGLHAALPLTPSALAQANDVLGDLDANEVALRSLVTNTTEVVDAAASSNPSVGNLISGAGSTLSAIASKSSALQSTLSKLPGTFTHVRNTLGHADATLVGARELTSNLAPDVTQLHTIAHPLDNLLTTLTRVGPDATDTLDVARRSVPSVTRLVSKVKQLSPELLSIGKQANTQLDCVRPYTPDLVAFFTDWGSALSGSDGKDKYIRADPEAFLPALDNDEYESPGTAAANNPGLTYAFPRPPGYMADQNWFLPQCGITQDSLNPNDDPEYKSFTGSDYIPGQGGSSSTASTRSGG